MVGIVALCLLCAAGGAALAWWQWDRYASASGTLQNLGYVLQWPLFGAFPAFLFWRIFRSGRGAHPAASRARQRADSTAQRQDGQVATAESSQEPQAPSRLAYVQRSAEANPADDPELRRYNRLLAELHEQADSHSQEEHRVR